VHKFDELRKLAIGVGSPNVGVVLDLWQWYAGGGSIDEIKQLTADQIVAVNLADAPADVPADQLTMQQRLLPGETNVVPSAEIVKWLSEIDYDGPVTARPDRTRFPKTGRVQIVRMIAESLNQVWIAAGLSVAAPLIPMVELATDEKADASADEEVEEEEVDETEVEAEVD
jgi:sugar phosphate isomerase/epimerase